MDLATCTMDLTLHALDLTLHAGVAQHMLAQLHAPKWPSMQDHFITPMGPEM